MPGHHSVVGDLSSWDCPSMHQVLWFGEVAVGRVGLREGDAAQALFAAAPDVAPSGPPTCPCHPTFLARSAPADVLAVMEVAEHSVLFFCWAHEPAEGHQGGQRRCGARDPLRYLRCPPPLRLAHHAAAYWEHRPSVARPQVHARRGLVDRLPV